MATEDEAGVVEAEQGAPSSASTAAERRKPRTSTRDRGELAQRLEAWLTTKLPGGADPQVSLFEAPGTGGLSSETLLFDVRRRDRVHDQTERLVARMAPEDDAIPVFPRYDLPGQARLIELVGEHSRVPVPRVLWSEPDPAHLGAPFFVMERIDGQIPPDVMPYNFGSWLSEATPAQQRHLQDSSVGILAGLYEIQGPEERFSFLVTGETPGSALRRHVDSQWSYYRWVADGLPLPLLERSFAWLDDHWPQHEGPTVLSWGDARPGNVIYRDFEPVAVLDWEMAALAPPEVDLAWFVFLHRFFEDIAGTLELPGMPTFCRREDVAATFEAQTGYTPRDLDFHCVYAALRHGIVMARVKRRAIHFGEDEMPDDPDDLVMHRAAIEAMLAGTYWEGLVW